MALTTIPVELVTLDDGVTITVDDNSDNLTLTSTGRTTLAGNEFGAGYLIFSFTYFVAQGE